jgi:hypothetical protein
LLRPGTGALRCNPPRGRVRKHLRLAWAAALLAALVAHPLWAAGLNTPNSFLDNGNHSVLVAPVSDFPAELARISLAPAQFHAVTNSDTFDGLAPATELLDLAAALGKAGLPGPEAEVICAAHRVELEKLAAWLQAAPQPAFPRLVPAIGLPDEFAHYFDGVVAWADPSATSKDSAREAWREVLNLPAPERHFKATWAAFMLGKSWQNEDPARAVTYFKRARDLSERGFADPLGLASASLGLEAQTELQQGHAAAAMQLYLEQFADGDQGAEKSLRLTASAALKQENAAALTALAADPKVRLVITAHLISHGQPGDLPEGHEASRKWLAVMEATGARDVSSAEEFALAAYQAEEWETAQKWIDRAARSPSAQWLQAKLLLRAGKVDQAADLLANVAALFPLQTPATNAPGQFKDDLMVDGFNDNKSIIPGEIPAPQQILGELGAVLLARGDYAGALDDLLRSGFRQDASYVADRVLTADELKDYVDRNWPAGTDDGIRHLLARRLARLHREGEARPYYPAGLLPESDALTQALAQGADLTLPDADRAKALFAAAQMTQTNGPDLLESEMDWSWNQGTNLADQTIPFRAQATMLPASEDELRRLGQSAPDPDVRYHYRFQAAALAWQAAVLMPDNMDETARVLCQAGNWIKYLDPRKADLFYKTLVQRCRRTAIGAQADRMRWFPVLDAAGNPVPYEPPALK